MATLMKWKQPKPVADLEFRRNMGALRSLSWRYIKWWAILGGVTLFAVYRKNPEDLGQVAIVMAFAAAFLPALLILTLLLARVDGISYEFGERGFLRRGGNNSHFYRWNDIKGFSICTYPEVPDMRCVRFSIRVFRKTVRREVAFDPSEVDESLLRSILEEHLPGKGS